MIIVKDNLFALQTKETSYVFFVNEIKYLEHLYYGSRIETLDNTLEVLKDKYQFQIGGGISYDKDHTTLTLESKYLEYSSRGKGDIRNPMIEILDSTGNRTSDFKYQSYEIRKHQEMKTMPSSTSKDEDIEDLVIILLDQESNVEVKLIYSIFENSDVITRRMEVKNLGEEKVKLLRAFSLQLDMKNDHYVFTSFHGSWIREMNRYDQELVIGTLISESLIGASSSRSNPFVMISKKGCQENIGEVYGFNLIYSGNHMESCEVDSWNKLRFLTGINPTTFDWTLEKDQVFETPEAVMTYSNKGFNKMSHQMHDFVNKHIVRGEWSNIPRPVLNNSWEAAYFKFNERKLLKMAKAAKKAGIELFVLDDGWFGTRNDDFQGLGDWTENKKKLPKGLLGLSKRINKIGMDFGIWVEPESVNERSKLYQEHPEWALRNLNRHHSEGRNQMLLDLSNDEVVDYLIDSMTYVFSQGVKYVKWDMNRIFSDYYSPTLEKEKMNELAHRYMIGLYRLLDTLTKRFPHILFESCAGGGNRFDLGMLCFMPQTWGSDNSDAISRVTIQRGYSYGYPLNTVGSHVSSSPNHQTLRNSTLESRFNIACLGQLGYELNIAELNRKQRKEIKEQITLYKTMRTNLLKNDFYRGDDEGNTSTFSVVSKDKKHAIGVIVSKLNKHGDSDNKIEISSLEEKGLYHVHSKDYKHSISKFGGLVNQVSPIHLNENSKLVKFISKFVHMKEDGLNYNTSGEIINQVGVSLPYNFMGTGFNSKTRVSLDQEVRMIFIDKIEG